MVETILNSWQYLGSWLKQFFKQWTKPATFMLGAGVLADATRSRADLTIENAMLRQQLIVLNRQVKQPHFMQGDRIRLVLLARCSRFWHQALYLIQPDTLLHWHRALFRFYWRLKSAKLSGMCVRLTRNSRQQESGSQIPFLAPALLLV